MKSLAGRKDLEKITPAVALRLVLAMTLCALEGDMSRRAEKHP